jgi:hypothetical protein
MFKRWGSRFLVRQLMVFDFWVAVRDLDPGTKAALFGPPTVSVHRLSPDPELPEG